MSRIAVVVAGSLVLMAVLIVLLRRSTDPVTQAKPIGDTSSATKPPLMIFCAASNRAVMEKTVQDYASEFGRQVDIQFGP
ncbi:MAG: hypothetical protein VXZ38_11030, partial [Planctomycetota bacterium]|nr:hypothetical protein [Planctomycetota bacterium]